MSRLHSTQRREPPERLKTATKTPGGENGESRIGGNTINKEQDVPTMTKARDDLKGMTVAEEAKTKASREEHGKTEADGEEGER